MSLETLLEAAKYVEQQELRQAQAQRVAFRVMSPSVPTTAPPPAPPPAPPAPPPLPCPQLARSPAAAAPAPAAPGTHLPIGAGSHRSHLVLTATQQAPLPAPTVSEVLKPQQPVPVQTQPVSTATLSNGVDKCMVVEDGVAVAAAAAQELRKRHVHVQCVNKPGTREVHNKLEKNRRAHLKECFELLKKQLPAQQDEKKSSNLSILHSAYRHIQALKKKERENEHEMERLARDKIAAQQKLAALKKEMGAQWDNIDFNTLLPEQGVTAATAATAVTTSVVPASPAPALAVKEERTSDGEDGRTANPTALAPPQLSVHLPLPQVGYPVSQGLVLGVHKVALVSKSLPLVTSPVTHIIATPPQLNGKVVPLVNAQYLMKPVVVVSTASAGGTTISPRPS